MSHMTYDDGKRVYAGQDIILDGERMTIQIVAKPQLLVLRKHGTREWITPHATLKRWRRKNARV